MTNPTDFLKSKGDDKAISFIKKTMGGNKYIDFLNNKNLLDNLVDIYENSKNNQDDMEAFKLGVKQISKNIHMSMTFDKSFSEDLSFNAPLSSSIRNTMTNKAFNIIKGMSVKDVFGEDIVHGPIDKPDGNINSVDDFKSIMIDVSHENSPHYSEKKHVEASAKFCSVLNGKGLDEKTVEKYMDATLGQEKNIKKALKKQKI